MSALQAVVLFVVGATGIDSATAQPQVLTEDTTRFFRVLDAADGMPTAGRLQADYLDPGSPALHDFLETRIGSAEKLARKIADDPGLYERARQCAHALPEIEHRVATSLQKLGELYDQARFPPVAIVVGRGNSGGTTSPAGVIVGLEALCRADWLQADIGDRFLHLIAHEYAHVQQPGAAVEPPADATLLYQTLIEGGAEFLGELISGQVTNVHLHEWARGKECMIERAFAADAQGQDTSRWLYNGLGDDAWRGDLGYWVGYRIVSSYYTRADDKRRALAEILQVTPENATALLQRSGWSPQADCGSGPPLP
ncbi:DUF2268 domain-containing putative Zn-dependent protease [Stenotrophomonas sp. AB1(2024)]|uniref:DUF2268 domain-containing putative Zn-dependent protease n=1 Tax=Stenotrophomonas sp. AB1(2024) TaxID=3132215 RepID=UPI0030B0DEEB